MLGLSFRSVLAASTVALALAACGGEAAMPAQDPTTAGTVAKSDIVDTAAGAGSFKTFVAAVKAADLESTLRGSGPFTVFAPTDEAFAKLPAGTVESLLKPENKEKLKAILTYHVVPGQITPADIAGEHTTVQGGTLEVTGSGDDWMVNDSMVICGGVQTANATVYLVDTVLMPPM